MKKLSLLLIDSAPMKLLLIVLMAFSLAVPCVNAEAVASEVDQAVQKQTWQDCTVQFDGVKTTEDTPWGFNAGIIDSDEQSQWILLNPNTSVLIYDAKDDMQSSLYARVHPWVAELSDGVGILVWYMDDEDNTVYQQEISVDNSDKWKPLNLDSDHFSEAASIKLLCNNGINNDDTGDWLIISNGSRQSINEESSALTWDGLGVAFDGVQETQDTPWGINAGVIDAESDGQCALLLPGTMANVSIGDLSFSRLDLMFRIYPEVAANSDGARVHICVYDETENILKDQILDLDNSSDWTMALIYADACPNAAHINISCESASGGEDCDWVTVRLAKRNESTFTGQSYVKSATYFGDEWPKNLWNSEFDHITEDFKQIKADGFDSIILVIPWREFQPTVDPVSYNGYAFEQLDMVMEKALEASLNVYVRLGYTWDYYNDSDDFIVDWFIRLLKDQVARAAWMDYSEKIYESLCHFENFRGGFITWEDFWGALSICDIESDVDRITWARDIGYQTWIENNYALEQYNAQYNTAYDAYASIPVPHRNETAMESMYLFFDEYLSGLLQETQIHFPNLSMEVRMDADPVYKPDGTMEYFSHYRTFDCGNSDFVSTMYGIPMGYPNQGERVSADDAAQHTRYILKRFSQQNDNKPVYIDQFIFFDNTAEFENNARIKKEEIDDYLADIDQTLLEFSHGYAIWTYRDYYFNMFYNNGFALKEAGWIVDDGVSFEKVGESTSCRLKEGQSLSQAIPITRDCVESDAYTVSFDVTRCDKPGRITVSMGNATSELDIETTGNYTLVFDRNDSFDFKLQSLSGDFCFDNFRMYSFIQEGYLYDVNNGESDFIECIRELNAALDR